MPSPFFPIWWLFYSLLKTFEIGKEVVNIRRRYFVEQFAMSHQGVLQFDLHLTERERSIPTGGVAQGNHKIVGMHHWTLDLLARGKSHDSDGELASGIKHSRLKFDGRILRGDCSQITRGRMTALAAAGAVKKRLTGFWIASKQLFDRILTWDPRGFQSFGGTRVQISGYVQNLLIS